MELVVLAKTKLAQETEQLVTENLARERELLVSAQQTVAIEW